MFFQEKRVQLFTIIAVFMAIVLVIFAVQNSALITLSFINLHFQGSLALILALVFASGFLAGVLVTIPSVFKRGSALRETRRRLKQFETIQPDDSK